MTIRPAGTSLALWILGFVWGVIVFAIPTLKNTPAIPYVSKYPWISSVLTVGYVILLYYISKKHLEGASSAERMRFGSIILAVNFGLPGWLPRAAPFRRLLQLPLNLGVIRSLHSNPIVSDR